MPARFTDAEIAVFIAERKVLPEDYKDMFKLKAKRGHDECEFDLSGVEGTPFESFSGEIRSTGWIFHVF
jgi:hypothetical protein